MKNTLRMSLQFLGASARFLIYPVRLGTVKNTLRTGLQFLGVSARFLLLSALCMWLLGDNVKRANPNHLHTALYYGSALLGFLAVATGLVAASYLVSSAIEAIGRLLGRKKRVPDGVASSDGETSVNDLINDS